jgi:hypothetical protein
LLEPPLIKTSLLLQLLFALTPKALAFGFLGSQVVLTLTPGLLLATAPFVALLIGQSRLLRPPALVIVAGLALRVTIAALIAVALSFPLAALVVELLLLRSTLLFAEPALLVCLSALLSQLTLLLLILLLA